MSHISRPRKLRLLVVTIMATIGLVATTALPAQAYSRYEDQSSESRFYDAGGVNFKCADDAVTVREAYWPGGGRLLAVELRYSKRCRSVWARGKDFYGLAINSYQKNSAGAWVLRASRYDGRNPYTPQGKDHWTIMLDDANMLGEACVDYGVVGEERMCTGRY
ncbi:DUF2690 domain-containing protein [Actinoplanes sp. NPDC048791]|uniref:DUF2690 domain-containing protein n=1 Tax=Actinoplanes sp. NPDC048791 TaxID=3154623 RepID=UPI0033F58EFD